jgi:hypothetical protein
MLRLSVPAKFVQSCGVHIVYFCAMGALVVACTMLGSKVSRKIAVLATGEIPTAPRVMSRVEQQAGIRNVASIDVAPSPVRPAMPLAVPDIHPAELAAAMDRVETAKAAVSESASDTVITVAVCDVATCQAPQVKGWAKTQKAKAPAALGKGVRAAAANRGPVRKKLAAAARKGGPSAGQPTFATIFGTTRRIRLAETPAEIIRRNLLGTS